MFASAAQFPFDFSQAELQLRLMGYELGKDLIFLRYIDPQKKLPTICRPGCLDLPVSDIEQRQAQGYDVYFVANGQGHKKVEVQFGRAFFYEHDHLDKVAQKDLWKVKGLPEPTFQLDTGGKSIHNYLALTEPVTIKQWEQLQSDLLDYTDADRTIKDPSRVMRLAGSWHLKSGGTNQCRIISESGNRYTISELRAIIPTKQVDQQPQPELNYQPSTTVDIPLYQCLSTKDRALIDNGASSNRNSQGTKLAKDLIGAAARLPHLGYRTNDNPYDLFIEYCQKCNQDDWPQKEWEDIWRKAEKSNPKPTLTDDAIKNCAEAWLRKQQPQHQQQQRQDSSQPNNVVQHPTANREIWDSARLKAELTKHIQADTPESELLALFPEIARASDRSATDIKNLYQSMVGDTELVELREETLAEVEHLLLAPQKKLDLERILPPTLAEPITKLSTWLNLRSECYFTALLCGLSGIHHPDTELCVHRAYEFSVSPNIFGGIVAESSQKKSPIMKAMILKPMSELRKAEKERFFKAEKQYKEDLEAWEQQPKPQGGQPPEPPPPQRVFYFNNATDEGLRNQAERQQGKGMLALYDELAGLFKSANQYRGGKGADTENRLSYYDGMGQLVLRAEGIVADFPKLPLGIFGTIQPGILEQLIGSEYSDANGEWARFIFVTQHLAASNWTDDGGKLELTPRIAGLYQKVANLPGKEYFLTKEAQKLFGKIYLSIEQKRINDPNQAVRAMLGKVPGAIAKIALNLHIMHELEAGKSEPDQYISRDTLKLAIECSRFYTDEVRTLNINIASTTLAPHIARLIQMSLRKPGDGYIGAREICRATSGKQRPTSATARLWMQEAVAIGKGALRGSGRNIEFTAKFNPQNDTTPPTDTTPPNILLKMPFVDNVDKKSINLSITETPTPQDSQPFVDNVDNVDNFSKNLELEKTEQEYSSPGNEGDKGLGDKNSEIYRHLSTLSTNSQDSYTESDSVVDNVIDKFIDIIDKSPAATVNQPVPLPEVEVRPGVEVQVVEPVPVTELGGFKPGAIVESRGGFVGVLISPQTDSFGRDGWIMRGKDWWWEVEEQTRYYWEYELELFKSSFVSLYNLSPVPVVPTPTPTPAPTAEVVPEVVPEVEVAPEVAVEPKTCMDYLRGHKAKKAAAKQPEQPTEIGVGVLVESESGFLGGVVAAGTEADTWIVRGCASYLEDVRSRQFPATELRLR